MFGLIGFSSTSFAQCANDNTLNATIDASSITTGTTLSTCTFGGEYLLITNMQSGSTYTFETCGDTGFDTQLTIFNDASGAVVGFNDDFCGLQSSVSFVSDGSSVRVSLDQFNCQDNTTCMTIVGSVTGPAGDPCASISALSGCGDTGSFSLAGSGLFDGNGPFSTPGAEQIFSFTATITGSHLIDVTNNSGFVDLFFVDAAGGCSGTGWTYVDDILTSASNAVNLVAGTTYYFLIDDENTSASDGTITINCPSGANPCDSIIPIAACGDVASYSLSGAGAFDGNGPFATPGSEQIFSFTATATGAHLIDVVNNSGFVDLFFVDAAAGCAGTGWTYVDDILSTASNSLNLVAGTTYYFLIDDENLDPSAGTISVTCPSGFDPCDDIMVLDGCDASDTYSLATGLGAFDNIGPFSTPGQEVIFEYTAPLDGDYEIEITHTGGSFVDLFIADAAGGCSGSGWTYVDDILGSATNTINLVAGNTYYFMIDDENTDASDGTISIECPCIVSSSPDSTFVYNGPFVVAGSTDDACNDCDLRPSEDIIYEIEIPCAGTYTFETCGAGTSFDTYMYITDAFCGNVLFLNDDNCGLQSSITAALSAGTYYVNIEAFSSFVTGDFELSVSGTEDIIDIEIDAFSNVSCFGGSDGSATAVVSSGTMPFNYQWSDGQTTATASGLTIGTYTVSGTDANGCVSDTATVTLTEPTELLGFTSCPNLICYDGTADMAVFAFGGTPPYTGTGVFNVGVGTHTYTITDANGCSVTVSHTVTAPPPLVFNITSPGIDCFGGTTDVTVSGSGGTPPYTGTFGTFNVSAGTYTYTMTDANGCTADTTITVTEPPLLVASATVTNPILCNGGTGDVLVSATGGTPPYTGVGTFSEVAGTYTYTVTDANGCTATTSAVTLTEPTALTVFVSCPAILCNGGTVDIGVAAFGGTPPYTGTGVFNLGAGTYTFTVTDANGCTASSTHTVTEPAPLVLTISTAGIDCNGGTADVTVSASGGTAPYSGDMGTYNVGAGTYVYSITDANGCTTTDSITLVDPPVLMASASAGTILCNGGSADVTVTATGGTPPYSGVGTFSEMAGTYTYTVNDANGCTATTSSITLTEPSLMTAYVSCPAILCNGGTTDIAVYAFGGTPPYSGIGVFNVGAGTYTYTVTDANGCTSTVTHTVTEPAPLVVSLSAAPTSCTTGYAEVTVSASGGTAPYSGTGTFNEIAGTYTYTVTDANGCSATETITVDPCVQTYCDSYATCSSYEWINCVTIGSINNYSGNNGGYGDFSSMVTSAAPGDVVNLNLAPGFSGQSYSEAWRVWIDWNNDGDFNDQGEFIGQGYSSSPLTGSFTVPQYAVQNTNLRIRVSMQWACHRYPGPCSIFTYGEVEDYSIYVSTPTSSPTVVAAADKDTELAQVEAFTAIGSESNKSGSSDEISDEALIQGAGIEIANIYPNPVLSSDGLFNLELRAGNSTDVIVRIIDFSGKVLFTDAMHLESGVNERALDATGFAQGSYMIEIVSGDFKGTTQLVVQ